MRGPRGLSILSASRVALESTALTVAGVVVADFLFDGFTVTATALALFGIVFAIADQAAVLAASAARARREQGAALGSSCLGAL